ncbi:DUF2510 domain-containing protein [Rhodococcus xishaensis]|nr:DUF2510 domain-containing protein [Rhodococcus xishaensis]
MPEQITTGWYPDQRFWDGANWTSATRPRPPVTTKGAAPPATATEGARAGFAMLQWVLAILAGISVIVTIVMFSMGVDAGYRNCGTLMNSQYDNLECAKALNDRADQAGIAVVVMLVLIALTIVATVQRQKLSKSEP